MDMYGYGTTEQGNYFYFRRQYEFFYCSYVFPPSFFYFFSMAGSPMKFVEMQIKCRQEKNVCVGGGTPQPPLVTSLGINDQNSWDSEYSITTMHVRIWLILFKSG